jgi:hypothetical protein
MIASDWKRDGNQLTLRIQVPVGSTGTVQLPITHSRDVEAPDGAVLGSDTEGHPVWKVGSGIFEFRATVKRIEEGRDSVAAVPRPKPATAPETGHYVGEQFGGGIVVWVTPDGQHGLIASSRDLDAGMGAPWSNIVDAEVGASAATPGRQPQKSHVDGRGNTTAIVGQKGHASSAAKMCRDYSEGGFNDWYLPSRIELQILTAQAGLLGRVLSEDGNPNTKGLETNYVAPTFGGYWSSTEANGSCAWYYDFNLSGDISHDATGNESLRYNFSTGNASFRAKDRPCRVRAVRRF